MPKGKKPIESKWVYKVKLKLDGGLERFITRPVAKDFSQQYGIDYEETFSPVVKMSTIRCILAITTSHNGSYMQLDINNAFLHGDLHEEVFIKVSEGLECKPNQVCLVNKSLYVLKQASRQCHIKLLDELKSLGYTQSKNDYSLFLKKQTKQKDCDYCSLC